MPPDLLTVTSSTLIELSTIFHGNPFKTFMKEIFVVKIITFPLNVIWEALVLMVIVMEFMADTL